MPDSITFAQWLPNLLIVAGLGLAGFVLLSQVRRRLASRATDESPGEFIQRVRGESGGESAGSAARGDEMQRLDALFRQHAAALDARAMRLEKLLKSADARIAKVEGLLASLPASSVSPPRPEGNADSPFAELEAETRRLLEEVASMRRPRRSAAPEADERLPEVQTTPAARASKARPATDPLTASVLELADRGKTPVEIARELDEQVGKVQLILALRDDLVSA